MSEDFDLYSGESRSLYGGKNQNKSLNDCRLLDITASSLLSQVIWHVDEAPTKARINDLELASPIPLGYGDACPAYISKELYNYPLCSGRIKLMAPVIDPLKRQCDIIFYEEITVTPKNNRGPVKFSDVFEALYKFYNLYDPSDDLVDTLTTLIQNGGASLGPEGLGTLKESAKRAVQGVRMNLQVPQVELLGTSRLFAGLIAWGDGSFFVKLKDEGKERKTARTKFEAASAEPPKNRSPN